MRNIFVVNATQVVVSESHPEGLYERKGDVYGVNLLQCHALSDGTNRNVTFTKYTDSNGETERVHISGTASAANGFRNLTYDVAKPYAWPQMARMPHMDIQPGQQSYSLETQLHHRTVTAWHMAEV